jgi:hypothetical protein
MSIRTVLATFFFVTILAYGIFVPWLGYYGDDWPGIYNLVTGGLPAMVDYQSFDRPIWGWISGIEHQVIGDRPVGWHIYAALTRYVSAIALWFLCRQIWPKRQIEGAAVALLFLVYPGILQESRGFTYGTIWLQLALFIFSLVLMVKSVRTKQYKITLMMMAVLIAGASWSINEYFMGLELLRPFILWVVISEQTDKPLRRVQSVINYLVLFIITIFGYIVFRLNVFNTTRSEVDPKFFLSEIYLDPVQQFSQRLEHVIPDLVETSLLVWTRVLSEENLRFTSGSTWLAWGIGTLVIMSVFLLLTNLQSDLDDRGLKNRQTIKVWSITGIIGGLLAIITGMLPIWYSNVHYISSDGASRYALPAILGAALLITGLLRLVASNSRQLAIYVSILVGIGTVAHVKSANEFRHEWSDQKQLLSQFVWRIPSLEPGTIVWIQSDVWRKRHPAGYTYAMPLNLIYAPENNTSKLTYWVLPREEDIEKFRLYETQGGILSRGIRNLRFEGSLAQTIVVWYSPPSCLRVIDNSSEIPNLENHQVNAAKKYSNIDLIIRPDEVSPLVPESIFGSNPERDWCFYFEKAELAKQFHNWKRIVELADEARSRGLSPRDTTEWQPFIEGYKKIGRENDAKMLSKIYEGS